MGIDAKTAGTDRTENRIIRRSSLHDETVAALREMIVTGALPPGARIIEQDLSQQLGVSRTPIREAIKILTLDGLVDSPAHRGARVKPLDVNEIETLFDVISVLEALAAEHAAARMTVDTLNRLEEIHARMRHAFETGDRALYFDLNTKIHAFLVAESGNPILVETHARLMLRASRGRYLAILSGPRWAEAMQQHEDLMTTLRNKDPERAAQVWRKHLKMTSQVLVASLKQALLQ